jgi:SAM-dependent methyltransferase
MTHQAREHWESIYRTKSPEEVSWTQETPEASLDFIHRFRIRKDARIIDIGGGDSKLVDHLLAEGYTDLTVLDISAAAIERARTRLGPDARRVKWIVCDILDFKPELPYDVWHDRAAFHFQTNRESIEAYLDIVRHSVSGIVILGTFSTDGPTKCSGLEVKQYDEFTMKQLFEANAFRNIECKREDHITPAGVVQNFLFCSFMKQNG